MGTNDPEARCIYGEDFDWVCDNLGCNVMDKYCPITMDDKSLLVHSAVTVRGI